MAIKQFNPIRFHPAGTGQTTGPYKAQSLLALAPLSFRKAQDVLVAAQKYINKSGFFSSEKSRLKNFQLECYELNRALKADGFMSKEREAKDEVFVFTEFFSLFADAFPNWQNEYELLNRFVPRFF